MVRFEPVEFQLLDKTKTPAYEEVQKVRYCKMKEFKHMEPILNTIAFEGEHCFWRNKYESLLYIAWTIQTVFGTTVW